ncbi:MAG: cation transporting ATPase C-terminal domain-containing protein, partial [Terrimicrobiaceae bacterium]
MRTELRIDKELTRGIGVDVDLLGQLNIGSGETFGASVAATFGFFVWRISAGVPFEVVQSETFTVLALCQWFNVLNCRSERGSTLN